MTSLSSAMSVSTNPSTISAAAAASPGLWLLELKGVPVKITSLEVDNSLPLVAAFELLEVEGLERYLFKMSSVVSSVVGTRMSSCEAIA